MLLRRLVAALGPLLLCVLVCAVFRWLDGMIEAASFLAFLLKGALLGAALALTLARMKADTVADQLPAAPLPLQPPNRSRRTCRKRPTTCRNSRSRSPPCSASWTRCPDIAAAVCRSAKG